MVFLSALALFALAWIIHLVWWRLSIPAHPGSALIVVFAGTPLAIGALGWVVCEVASLDLSAIGLFYVGAVLCYFITYTGIEESSPSLTIARALERAGAKGCNREELLRAFERENFVGRRINVLARDGIVAPTARGHVLTPRGECVARMSAQLRAILNISESA